MSVVRTIKYSIKKLISTLVGSHRKEADAILKLKDTISSSYWISLDPGSNSSGYAYWFGDKLVSSGSIKAKGNISERLQVMTAAMKGKAPEIAVVEKVRTSTGHVYLTWSTGALLAGVGAKHTLEISTMAWKKNTSTDYVKGDEQDAIEIGKYVLRLVKEDT